MYIINVIAIVWFVVSITIICVGISCLSDNTVHTGIVCLIFFILMSFAFHTGSEWQRNYTNEKYFLIEKQKPF